MFHCRNVIFLHYNGFPDLFEKKLIRYFVNSVKLNEPRRVWHLLKSFAGMKLNFGKLRFVTGHAGNHC